MSQPSRLIKVCGMDPSMNNWGIACGTYDLDTGEIVIAHVDTICPDQIDSKQVRVNSKDIHRAIQLYDGTIDIFREAQFTFVEVPIGTQSASGMKAYGMCIGILGSIRAAGIEFIEVTPTEVKVASFGNKNASKKQMIQWATSTHPDAPWSQYKKNGVMQFSEAKVEHQADAVAAIHAGVASAPFRQLLPYMKPNKE
jgi:Holliday junction resolvasome RuvABC endonuclease subunit